MAKYRTASVRYQFLDDVEDEGQAKQQLPEGYQDPALSGDPSGVRLLLGRAAWEEPGFRRAIVDLVREVNAAPSTEALVEAFGLSAEEFPLALRDARLRLRPEKPNKVVIGRFGPPKGFDRALQKEMGSLKDLNRVTLECEDPYVMALVLAILKKQFKVLAVKNKHRQATFKQPPDLHVNIDIGGGWVAEVQLLLANCLMIKRTLHKYYEISRVENPELVLQPVFNLEKAAEDEV